MSSVVEANRLATMEPIAHAILCDRLAKRYHVLDAGHTWRILFALNGEGTIVEALRGVSLEVQKGEILGVLGRNGSGKSTLLRVVGGIFPPTSGSVHVTGSIGSLFELGGLGNQYITGREYAERVLGFQGVPRRSIAALLEGIREFAELGEYFDRKLHTYSTGMGARLYFATAMALPRDAFLIDEVLSVGDAHFQAKSWRRVRERLSQGASGILVTHDWSAVIKLCRRAAVLQKGAVLTEGRADEVVARYLDAPRPDGAIARFLELKPAYEGVTGEDLAIDILVDCSRDVGLEFAFSIELLRLGRGWEILLLSDFVFSGRGFGKQAISLRVPKLPLAPGEYSLNLFLRSSLAEGGEPADARTWTTGNGLRLVVHGSLTSAITKLPVSWKVERMAHA